MHYLTLLLTVLLVAACDDIAPPGMVEDDAGAKASGPDNSGLPPGHPPIDGGVIPAPPLQADDDPSVATFVGLRAPKPPSWVKVDPRTAMRKAQYAIPGSGDSGGAEMVVFYFGPGQGGDVQDNIDRWAGQVTGPDGQPGTPQLHELEADGMTITVVELAGSYTDMGGIAMPDHGFLGAIIEAPDGNVFIRMVGPAETISENRDDFVAMLEGIESAADDT